MTARKLIIVLTHAFVGWALCGATIAIGMSTTTQENTLIIHAILAPAYFLLLTTFYVRKFNYTTPLQTALVFILSVS